MDVVPYMLCKQLETKVIEIFDKYGLFYRVFSRIKTEESMNSKLESKKYSGDEKMQDLFGIRVATYFKSDVEICDEILSRHFENIPTSNSIDKHDDDKFKASRHNKIYKLPNNIACEIRDDLKNLPVDLTFEVQFRTILSEGWHEVEHDLRYKNKGDWNEHKDSSRHLNGILATLETCDWGIEKLFDDLAYRHYKDKKWIAMLKNKFKLRLIETSECSELFEECINDTLGKKLYRFERAELFNLIDKYPLKFSFQCSDILYLLNYFVFKDKKIIEKTPPGTIDLFSRMEVKR